MYTISIWQNNGEKKFLENIQPYQTLLEICFDNGIDLPHQCGGVCHCTTCQVYVTKGMNFLEEPSRRELDFLKRAKDAKPISRLACQSMLTDGTGELKIELPTEEV